MPFGSKPGRDGQAIDFNSVFAQDIVPALEDAGLTVFRADQEVRAGDIRTDMFQELLLADLLYSALALGIDKVRFICLWDGGGGDGPGGTAHMYSEVERRTGRVTWIDTRTL